MKKGGKVFEIKDKYLHMKVYGVDNKMFTIGSLNNDYWSWGINNEINVL